MIDLRNVTSITDSQGREVVGVYFHDELIWSNNGDGGYDEGGGEVPEEEEDTSLKFNLDVSKLLEYDFSMSIDGHEFTDVDENGIVSTHDGYLVCADGTTFKLGESDAVFKIELDTNVVTYAWFGIGDNTYDNFIVSEEIYGDEPDPETGEITSEYFMSVQINIGDADSVYLVNGGDVSNSSYIGFNTYADDEEGEDL